MSYEGYEEWKCACGKLEAADVGMTQPTRCECGCRFVQHRAVDQTNDPTEYGEWMDVEFRPVFNDYVRKGYSVAAPEPDSFCDQVLARPDVKTAIADEAKKIVNGARRSAYGRPEDNFERIARFWQVYFENTGRPEAGITARDVSPLMRLMKEARLCETPDHRDSFVDLVGYTLTGAEVNGVAA